MQHLQSNDLPKAAAEEAPDHWEMPAWADLQTAVVVWSSVNNVVKSRCIDNRSDFNALLWGRDQCRWSAWFRNNRTEEQQAW